MCLTQYKYGLPFVATVSFFAWLVLNVFSICFNALYADQPPPDARIGGCDNYFTLGLRALVGDQFRKPVYDLIYDVNFSFIWLFGIIFAAWYFARSLVLRQQTMTLPFGR
jgi:hypothetical protein